MAVMAICRACVEAGAWTALNDNILLISKRRSQLKQAITSLVQASDRQPSAGSLRGPCKMREHAPCHWLWGVVAIFALPCGDARS